MSSPTENGIRPFIQSDIGALRQLICDTIDISYSNVYPPRAVAFFKDFHAEEKIVERSQTGTVLVAVENDTLAATGSLVEGEIFAVFVHPKFQKKDLGKALMNVLEGHARANGIIESVLSVSLPSRYFYEGLGYEIFEERSQDLGAGQRLDSWKAGKRLVGLET